MLSFSDCSFNFSRRHLRDVKKSEIKLSNYSLCAPNSLSSINIYFIPKLLYMLNNQDQLKVIFSFAFICCCRKCNFGFIISIETFKTETFCGLFIENNFFCYNKRLTLRLKTEYWLAQSCGIVFLSFSRVLLINPICIFKNVHTSETKKIYPKNKIVYWTCVEKYYDNVLAHIYLNSTP